MKLMPWMTALALFLSLVTVFSTMADDSQPNILVIMSDDMGISDIGCYGSEIETPVLDRLAAGGVRFTQFYNTARCCPTRASLLTGLYPHQAGVGSMMNDRGVDGYRGELNKNCRTIAEVLKTAGYATYMSGKWHVTKMIAPKSVKDKYNWPRQRGFDRFYGTIHGAGSLWDPNTLTRDNTYITPDNDLEYQPKDPWFYTDAISDNAVKYIREHKGDHPFFMYVAYTAAHWPMHAPEKDISKYKGKYDAGFEPIRTARHAKMKKLGIVTKDSKLSAQAGDWKGVADKSWEARNMEVYAAMIDNMDQGIGRIVTELEKQKKLDHTLILFLQDNGGCAENMGRRGKGKPRAKKPSLPLMGKDELQTRVIPSQSRDGFPMRQGIGVMAGAADTYIGYGRGWANVSDTPFREYKHWVHEGGISTPLIVHWPAKVRAKAELRHTPSHLIDIMATCVDVAGADYPKQYDGNAIKPMEGVSLVPVFDDKPIDREAIYWEHERNCAIRVGKWKLVGRGVLTDNGPDINKWELYDMEEDRSELNNLAKSNPEMLRKLHDKYMEYCKRANVIPTLSRERQQKREERRERKKNKKIEAIKEKKDK
jgi:arylsulfatase A-like enzyme